MGESRPLAGVTLILVDSTGEHATATISDSSGHFAVRAPRPGVYRLRARRIGFLPDTSQWLRLVTAFRVDYDPELTHAPTLSTIKVTADKQCSGQPAAGTATARVWEEAQSALTATVITPDVREIGFVLRQYERELDPTTTRILREQSSERRTVGRASYAAIAADTLVVHGFTHADGRFTIYYAPDASTLISDAFVASHCLRLVEDSSRPRLIGLGFAPMRAHPATNDVTGVLWLDRTTSELRSLDFTYTRPGNQATADVARPASGTIEYQRLPEGGWVVSKWQIRVPVMREVTHRSPTAGTDLGAGMILASRTSYEVAAIFEAGGEVTSTFPATTAPISSAASGVVAGRVETDSLHRPARHVKVILSSIRRGDSSRVYVAESDTTGAFSFDSIPEGTYTLQAGSREWNGPDSTAASRVLDIGRGSHAFVVLPVSSPTNAIAELCPQGVSPGAALLHGAVRSSSTGASIVGAMVRARWVEIQEVGSSRYSVTPMERRTTTNTEGRYAICDVPQDRAVSIEAASPNGRKGSVERIQLERGTNSLALDLPVP
jgi:hypothetical protein